MAILFQNQTAKLYKIGLNDECMSSLLWQKTGQKHQWLHEA